MSLITRFARLCRADLNALLDCIEEPETLLRLSLREMEEALDEDRRRGLAIVRECEHLGANIAEREQTVQILNTEIALCLGAGQDGLARSSIKRRLEAERALKVLNQKRAVLEAEQAELQTRLEANRERLEAVRQKAEALVPGTYAEEEDRPGRVSDDEVEVALLREKQSRGASHEDA
jgi:phage shock protein A